MPVWRNRTSKLHCCRTGAINDLSPRDLLASTRRRVALLIVPHELRRSSNRQVDGRLSRGANLALMTACSDASPNSDAVRASLLMKFF